jgi:hypothetical protein
MKECEARNNACLQPLAVKATTILIHVQIQVQMIVAA